MQERPAPEPHACRDPADITRVPAATRLDAAGGSGRHLREIVVGWSGLPPSVGPHWILFRSNLSPRRTSSEAGAEDRAGPGVRIARLAVAARERRATVIERMGTHPAAGRRGDQDDGASEQTRFDAWDTLPERSEVSSGAARRTALLRYAGATVYSAGELHQPASFSTNFARKPPVSPPKPTGPLPQPSQDTAVALVSRRMLILTAAVRLVAIDRPLLGNFAAKNVVYAMIARNWAEGRATLWYPTLDCLRGGSRSLHLMEWPASAYLTAGLWRTFGGSLDVWGRAVSVALSVAAVAVLFLLVRRRHGQTAAIGSRLRPRPVAGRDRRRPELHARNLGGVSHVGRDLLRRPLGTVPIFAAQATSLRRRLAAVRRENGTVPFLASGWLLLAGVSLALLLLTKIYMLVLLLPLAAMVLGRGDGGRSRRERLMAIGRARRGDRAGGGLVRPRHADLGRRPSAVGLGFLLRARQRRRAFPAPPVALHAGLLPAGVRRSFDRGAHAGRVDAAAGGPAGSFVAALRGVARGDGDPDGRAAAEVLRDELLLRRDPAAALHPGRAGLAADRPAAATRSRRDRRGARCWGWPPRFATPPSPPGSRPRKTGTSWPPPGRCSRSPRRTSRW